MNFKIVGQNCGTWLCGFVLGTIENGMKCLHNKTNVKCGDMIKCRVYTVSEGVSVQTAIYFTNFYCCK